jgi:hypothetical protein
MPDADTDRNIQDLVSAYGKVQGLVGPNNRDLFSPPHAPSPPHMGLAGRTNNVSGALYFSWSFLNCQQAVARRKLPYSSSPFPNQPYLLHLVHRLAEALQPGPVEFGRSSVSPSPEYF